MLTTYKSDVSSTYKELNAEEEIALYNRMKDGDESAKDELILSCLPLGLNIASRFKMSRIPFEDRLQEANRAIVESVPKFDPCRGRLTTVVYWAVYNRLINMFYLDRYSMSRHGYTMTISASQNCTKVADCNTDNIDEICKQTNLSRQVAAKYLKMTKSERVKLNDYNVSDEQQEVNSPIGCIADIVEIADQLDEPDDNKAIFKYWVDNNLSYKDTAKKFGKDRDSIRDIVYHFKSRIKKICRSTTYQTA